MVNPRVDDILGSVACMQENSTGRLVEFSILQVR